jgi:hypothetical protein
MSASISECRSHIEDGEWNGCKEIPLAHDLNLIPSGRYQQLSQEITEIKRMLTVLVQKLTADR